MTRPEAIGILICFAAVGIALAWLGLSRIWGRRRIPERVGPMFEPGTIHPVSITSGNPRLDEKIRRLQDEVIEPAEAQVAKAVSRSLEVHALANIVGRPVPETPIRARRRDEGPFQFPPLLRGFPYDQERENG